MKDFDLKIVYYYFYFVDIKKIDFDLKYLNYILLLKEH